MVTMINICFSTLNSKSCSEKTISIADIGYEQFEWDEMDDYEKWLTLRRVSEMFAEMQYECIAQEIPSASG